MINLRSLEKIIKDTLSLNNSLSSDMAGKINCVT